MSFQPRTGMSEGLVAERPCPLSEAVSVDVALICCSSFGERYSVANAIASNTNAERTAHRSAAGRLSAYSALRVSGCCPRDIGFARLSIEGGAAILRPNSAGLFTEPLLVPAATAFEYHLVIAGPFRPRAGRDHGPGVASWTP